MNAIRATRRSLPWPVVDRMVALAAQTLDDLIEARELDRAELTGDPLTALEQWPAVDVRRLPAALHVPASPGLAEACNVAGTYYEGTPTSRPIIAVAESLSAGRNAFTALHELGHHLQRNTDALADELGDLETDESFLVEDAVCDRFAAGVLIPADTADLALGDGNPTAGDIVALAQRTSASRAAVCVRAVQHLKTPGIVALLDPDDVVQYSDARDLYRLRRGSSQGAVNLIRKARERFAAGNTGFRVTDDDCRLEYRDGIEGRPLYAQAADIGGGYLVVVAVTERPAWKSGFTLPKFDTGPRARARICPHPECSEPFTNWAESHDLCGQPICTSCNRCACTVSHVKERLCNRCNLMKADHLFDDDATTCRDCE